MTDGAGSELLPVLMMAVELSENSFLLFITTLVVALETAYRRVIRLFQVLPEHLNRVDNV